ncbi:MAG: histidine kinase [Actinomycetia bacterium]|jgi:two-component system sensor histidine kinase BaeS|nr:histidine kinase [Actinomycetes bacterium]MDQ1659608.1 two-component system, OmpR family, sensor histidine kinase BaeS [Cryptosporangiaceae bacterium]
MRLLAASVLVAVCGVVATTWLAVTTTTKAIRTQQGQSLADDQRIYDGLVKYAIAHPRWDGAAPEVRQLSSSTGRAIVLTTADRKTTIARAGTTGPLPARPSAVIDPLHQDAALSSADQAGRIDPRIVGPYRITARDRDELDNTSHKVVECLSRQGIPAAITTSPRGRPTVQTATVGPRVQDNACATLLGRLPTTTEEPLVETLSRNASDCMLRQGKFEVTVFPDFTWEYNGKPDLAADRIAADCIDEARRQQLRPYVAPAALLFVTDRDGPDPGGFELSAKNTTRIATAAGLVLAVTLAVTVVVGLRLVRPLRVLISAAQRPAEESIRVRVTANDEIGYLAAAFNDLSERREQLERQRKSMVSDVAHELRTPLTNIRSWLEAAQDGITPANEDLIELLLDEAGLLQRIIDDLRDLAAADAGKLALHPEPLRAADVLDHAAAAHGGAADQAGVRIGIDAAGDPDLYADPLRLRQVIGNLVSNAIRHTPPGGSVTLRTRTDGPHVVLEVADTGSGIDPADLPHVFERFWRAEKSRNRQTGGSGLGLAIARNFTEAHGGSISVASTPGLGTTFTVRLPQ